MKCRHKPKLVEVGLPYRVFKCKKCGKVKIDNGYTGKVVMNYKHFT